jgi:hypothetical protein
MPRKSSAPASPRRRSSTSPIARASSPPSIDLVVSISAPLLLRSLDRGQQSRSPGCTQRPAVRVDERRHGVAHVAAKKTSPRRAPAPCAPPRAGSSSARTRCAPRPSRSRGAPWCGSATARLPFLLTGPGSKPPTPEREHSAAGHDELAGSRGAHPTRVLPRSGPAPSCKAWDLHDMERNPRAGTTL